MVLKKAIFCTSWQWLDPDSERRAVRLLVEKVQEGMTGQRAESRPRRRAVECLAAFLPGWLAVWPPVAPTAALALPLMLSFSPSLSLHNYVIYTLVSSFFTSTECTSPFIAHVHCFCCQSVSALHPSSVSDKSTTTTNIGMLEPSHTYVTWSRNELKIVQRVVNALNGLELP